MITKAELAQERMHLHHGGAGARIVSTEVGDRGERQLGGSRGLVNLPYHDDRACQSDSVRSATYLPHGGGRTRETSSLLRELFAFPCLEHGFSTILAKSRQIYQGYVQCSQQSGDHDHPRGRRIPQGQRANDLPTTGCQKVASFQGRWRLAIQAHGHRQLDSQSI